MSDDVKPYTREELEAKAAEWRQRVQAIKDEPKRKLREAQRVNLCEWTFTGFDRLLATALAGLADRDRRRVVSVMPDGLIVIHDDATEDELDRAFLRLTQFLEGDMVGLARSSPKAEGVSQSSGRGASATNDGGESYG